MLNPNLNPLSNSGVELAFGQEVFYFQNGDKRKKALLFVVGDQFKDGEVLEIDALIRENKYPSQIEVITFIVITL